MNQATNGSAKGVGELLHQLTADVRTLAIDEVELVKLEVTATIKKAAAEAAGVMLGGTVALIGLGLLCLTAVVAAAPLLPPLWARLLIMAVIYMGIGTALSGIFVKRLSIDNLEHAVKE